MPVHTRLDVEQRVREDGEKARRRTVCVNERRVPLPECIINMTNYVLHIWCVAITKNQGPFLPHRCTTKGRPLFHPGNEYDIDFPSCI